MKHLEFGGEFWCDSIQNDDATGDPREATCLDCLQRAASYGAAAAMRAAAVQSATAVSDAELARERDEAIRRVDAINDALEGQRAFFCVGCLKLFKTEQRGLTVNSTSWCGECAPHRKERAL